MLRRNQLVWLFGCLRKRQLTLYLFNKPLCKEQQIADLQKILATLRWKRNFYQKALESGELTICDADREKIAEAIIDDAL